MALGSVHALQANRSLRAAAHRQCRSRHVVRAGAAPPSSIGSTGAPPAQPRLLVSVVEALFQIPPLFALAAKNAREKIVKRGLAIGDDWDAVLSDLKSQEWDSALQEVTNPGVRYPAYYTQPFHAYPKGNLSMDAALEVTLAAKSVHATVMDPENKRLDPEGDHNLRSNYGREMTALLQQAGVDSSSIRRVLDLGCATGLSSLALSSLFPQAHVTGVDLSPYFLAVGRYQQQQREAAGGSKERVELVHGAAEATGLQAGSMDLVSACLVFHELPQSAARDIMQEAFRVLRPGGALTIMEMNPASPIWQRVFNNPFAYAAFKSTEPYLQEYVALDLHQAIRDAGFTWVDQRENSPRHRTVVAVKP